MLLSRPAILRHREKGNIVIVPFSKENVGTNSYDVTLGGWYFREKDPGAGLGVFNIYSERDVRRVWGEPQEAQSLRQWLDDNEHEHLGFYGIDLGDLVILVRPGQTLLCHTQEFIGGRGCVTTVMKARSSFGRVFIEVCKCAGMGDVGYINRWTMEITNNSAHHHVLLVVGRRIAQIVFHEVEPLEKDYADGGKYQTTTNLEEIEGSWSPDMMLPSLHKDREAVEAEAVRKAKEWDEKQQKDFRLPLEMRLFPSGESGSGDDPPF